MSILEQATSVLKDMMSAEGRLKLRIERSTKTLLERYAQSEARMEAAEKLKAIESPEAVYCLARRFSSYHREPGSGSRREAACSGHVGWIRREGGRAASALPASSQSSHVGDRCSQRSATRRGSRAVPRRDPSRGRSGTHSGGEGQSAHQRARTDESGRGRRRNHPLFEESGRHGAFTPRWSASRHTATNGRENHFWKL